MLTEQQQKALDLVSAACAQRPLPDNVRGSRLACRHQLAAFLCQLCWACRPDLQKPAEVDDNAPRFIAAWLHAITSEGTCLRALQP